jgi:hypothetical protein
MFLPCHTAKKCFCHVRWLEHFLPVSQGIWGPSFKKKLGFSGTVFSWLSLLVMMLGYCFHGLCTFPNMVIPANIARKSEKKGENTLICTVVENVGRFTWSVHISKYRNNSNKIGEK